MTSRKRIVIFATKTGGGHWSPAVAIAEEIERLAGDRFTVEVVDGLYGENGGMGLVVERGYSVLIRRARRLWGSVFRVTNHRLTFRLSSAFLARLKAKMTETLKSGEPPEAIVCTNSILLEPLGKVVKTHFPHTPYISVVTDLVMVHRAWAYKPLSLVLSPSPMATQGLVSQGMAPHKIQETGLPVSPQFYPIEAEEKQALAAQYGLDSQKPIVLIMHGAEGHNRVYQISEQLNGRFGSGVQQIVICGKNTKLLRKFEKLAPGKHVLVFGFSKEISHFMKIADVLVTKAGSLTVSEALASGCPLIISEFLPGQESGTPEWLIESGAAALAESVEKVVGEVEKLLTHPEMLRSRSRHARMLGRPHAAAAAAHTILAQAHMKAETSGTQNAQGRKSLSRYKLPFPRSAS